MAQTIGPLVKGRRPCSAGFAYLALGAGMALSASALGLALGVFGAAIRLGSSPLSVRAAMIAIFASVWVLHELRILHLPTPHRLRQVPAGWRLRFGPVLGSGFYGVTLGLGVLTFVGHTGLYVVLSTAVLVASPISGGLILLAYAAGRFASITAETLAELLAANWIQYLRTRGSLLRWTQASGLGSMALLAAIQVALAIR